jgi:hypothetical protein
VQGPSIPPGGTRPFRLGLPVDWSQAEALALRIDDPAGRELWTWVWPLPAAAGLLGAVYGPGDQAVTADKTDDAIVVKTGDLTLQIDRHTGMLKAAQRGTQSFSLTNGPRPASGTAALARLDQKQDGRDHVVTATFTGDLKSVTWRVQANGWVRCDYTYAAEGPADVLGVVFDYPEAQVKAKTWLGEGPYRVWKNRMAGTQFGVWHNAYNDTITGWSGWKYPEFKGCFANVRWIQLETTEGPITAVLGADDLFVQVLTPSLPPQKLQAKTAMSLPQAGLAFLHAIPAMGNKFHTAAQTGPQGQPTQARGEYAGSVSLYFGPLAQ